ncbi:hypothetical protein JM79_2018 [Gramella sp. Hel_I_59]|uniref:hypothetical protein n=1 Tax=Gramella sp. Hel_I_59 TaxID=1249978 RepID=UPI001151F930|nr:hypothetical protein [Gramella sp. Hel_I_59]TQI71092.1 hypothetical protein JM79_2018 [Gramella sp. Hel_I_59]
MMKIKFLLFVMFTLSIGAHAQDNFKGKIIYKLEFEIYNTDISKEMLTKTFGTGSTFLYKDGRYFQSYNNGSTDFDFMDSKSGKYYRKLSDNDTLFISDPTKKGNYSLINTEEGESDEKVLGYDCSYFKLNAQIDPINKKRFLKMYYTNKILIDGSLFEKIEKSFANIIYGRMNSIPIKFEIGDSSFKVIGTATKIEKNYEFDLDNIIQEKIESYPIKVEQF